MVLSGVALISTVEERGLFGLGFGLVSALLGIISAGSSLSLFPMSLPRLAFVLVGRYVGR